MNRVLMIILLGLVLASAGNGREADLGGADSKGDGLRCMSFNIRTLAPTDGRDFWFFRRGPVADLVLKHAPDVAGMQEVFTIQARGLEKRLTGYEWFGVGRKDGEGRGERCPVFYRKDRLELIDHATFWLSETPDAAGTKSWDAAFNRIVTWGKFRDKESGEVFFLFNTHFDHMGVVARRKSAELIVERVNEIAGDIPAVVTGDFNTTDDTIPYQTITSYLDDTRLISLTRPLGPKGTSRGFKLDSVPKKRIDYIFVSEGITAKDYEVLDDTYKNGRRPSDHMPVIVDVIFSEGTE